MTGAIMNKKKEVRVVMRDKEDINGISETTENLKHKVQRRPKIAEINNQENVVS